MEGVVKNDGGYLCYNTPMAYNTYKDQEKLRAYLRRKSRKRYARVRIESIRILGGKCKICKIDDYRVLQVDHIVPIGLPIR